MEIRRKQVIERIDPKGQNVGSPADKAPDQDLGHELIPKQRYTSADFMRREWEGIWSRVWLLG